MSEKTSIEWTEATWNPWHGCHKVSPGCKYCYMFRDKKRYGQDPNVVVRSKTTFHAPLKWWEPRLVFTCSWSDWFIEEADPWRDEAWEIIRATPQHTYQVLTKRIERAKDHLPSGWPFPNVWLGVSVENQETADERIPLLLQTPAAVRWVSYEPALGPVDFTHIPRPADLMRTFDALVDHTLDGRASARIDWLVVGGESGQKARPFDLEWARSAIRQCREAGVPVFMKQLGSKPYETDFKGALRRDQTVNIAAQRAPFLQGFTTVHTPDGETKEFRYMKLKNRKGGDISEFPADLRIREFPR